MYQARRLAAGIAALALLAGPPAAAQSASPVAAAPNAFAAVSGTAWDANSNPIAGARVRLRNVATTRIVAGGTATQAGTFTFDNIESGTYVVELIDAKSKVLGVGPMFTAQPGDRIATFVRLPGHSQGGGALFGNTAIVIVASAAGIGIAAVTATGRDVSPETARTTGAR